MKRISVPQPAAPHPCRYPPASHIFTYRPASRRPPARKRPCPEGPVIHVSRLTKYYGDYAAVRNVSFEVERGAVVGFLGPNGAGKSTTMRILAGYLTATSGKALIDGLDVFWRPVEVRRRIGY